MSQDSLMMFDPATGESHPFPSHAGQYRRHCGLIAWLFNPWSGDRRDARDVGTDTFGLLIKPPGESL
jgi:hypothetical protein